MQRLAEVARAAIVVDGDHPDLFRTQPDRGSWLADMLGRLAVRYARLRTASTSGPSSSFLHHHLRLTVGLPRLPGR